jgi:hypothetical protein
MTTRDNVFSCCSVLIVISCCVLAAVRAHSSPVIVAQFTPLNENQPFNVNDAKHHGFPAGNTMIVANLASAGSTLRAISLTASGNNMQSTVVWQVTGLRCVELFALPGSGSATGVCVNSTATGTLTNIVTFRSNNGSVIWATAGFQTMYPVTLMYPAGARYEVDGLIGLATWTQSELVRFDVTTGGVTWRWSLAAYCPMCFMPPTSMVYHSDSDMLVSCPLDSIGIIGHNATTGQLAWTQRTSQDIVYTSACALATAIGVSNTTSEIVNAHGSYVYGVMVTGGIGVIVNLFAANGTAAFSYAAPELHNVQTSPLQLLAPTRRGLTTLWLQLGAYIVSFPAGSQQPMVADDFPSSSIGILFGYAVIGSASNLNVYDPISCADVGQTVQIDQSVFSSIPNALWVQPSSAEAWTNALQGVPFSALVCGGSGAALIDGFGSPQARSVWSATWSFVGTSVALAGPSPLLPSSPLQAATMNTAIAPQFTIGSVQGQTITFAMMQGYSPNWHALAQPVTSPVVYAAVHLANGMHAVNAVELATGDVLWSSTSPLPLPSATPLRALRSVIVSVQPSGFIAFNRSSGAARMVNFETQCGSIQPAASPIAAADPVDPDMIWMVTGTGCLYRYQATTQVYEVFYLNAPAPTSHQFIVTETRIVLQYPNCQFTVLQLLGANRVPAAYSSFMVSTFVMPQSGIAGGCVATVAGDRLMILRQSQSSWYYGPLTPTALLSYPIGGVGVDAVTAPANFTTLTSNPVWVYPPGIAENEQGDAQWSRIFPYNGTAIVVGNTGVFIFSVADEAPNRLLWSFPLAGAYLASSSHWDASTATLYVLGQQATYCMQLRNVSATAATVTFLFNNSVTTTGEIFGTVGTNATAPENVKLLAVVQDDGNAVFLDGLTGFIVAQLPTNVYGITSPTQAAMCGFVGGATPTALLPLSANGRVMAMTWPNASPRLPVDIVEGAAAQQQVLPIGFSPTTFPGPTPPPAPNSTPPPKVRAYSPFAYFTTSGQFNFVATIQSSWLGTALVVTSQPTTVANPYTGNTVPDATVVWALSNCNQYLQSATAVFCLRSDGIRGRNFNVAPGVAGANWTVQANWTRRSPSLASCMIPRRTSCVWYSAARRTRCVTSGPPAHLPSHRPRSARP